MLLTPLALSAVLAAASNTPPEKPLKPFATLSKEPKIDGVLKDLNGATELKSPRQADKALDVKVGFKKDTLYIGVAASDDKVTMGDRVALHLFFPTAGTTAKGFRYTFAADGKRADSEGAPQWVQDLVKAQVKTDAKGMAVEVAIPARALPRFPAQPNMQLALNVCVDFADKDEGDKVTEYSSCTSGEMVGGPMKLPDDLRKALKLNPPTTVEGIEGRPNGWVGYAILHYPNWVVADEALTSESLPVLIAGEAAVDPKSVQLPIPSQLSLADNRQIFTVLTGKNPYSGDKCDGEHELRMAMYVIKEKVGSRVLEWPAATCSLGRAMRFELSADDNLAIGYTNGSTARFTFANEKFERSELGSNH